MSPDVNCKDDVQHLRQEIEALSRRVRQMEQTEALILAISEHTASASGEIFFRALARHLSETLGVRYAVVGELVPHSPDRIRSLAVWSGGRYLDNFEYELAGTPCENVISCGQCFYSANIPEQFPNSAMLAAMGVETYVGAPLLDAGAHPVGLLVALHDQPLADSSAIRSILSILAIRAGAEIERRRVDQQLRAAHQNLEQRVVERTAELSRAHQELKDLLHIISHDLRAPLVNLRGFAGELRRSLDQLRELVTPALGRLAEDRREELDWLLDDDLPEALGFIDSSVNRVDHFMNTLLKLSQEGRRELVPEPVDLAALAAEVLQVLAFQLEQRRARVTVGELPVITADRMSMEQILNNLLSNAVLYLDPERPGAVEISAEENGNQVLLRVKDNGRGIAEDDLPHIFRPFRRGRHQDVPGEGMGLAYVKTLVQRHGGRIWCESEPDAGTTFSLTLSSTYLEQSLAAAPAPEPLHIPSSGVPIPLTV